ncbi:MAG: DUF934 domain-containing protein [Gammaproteobacteria bacterium]|nr:DUF934 domain-containing protein [Gammaproteobacteria bacterium]
MLFKNGEITNNQWIHLTTEEIPEKGCVTLPMQRWLDEQDQMTARGLPSGVRLSPDCDFTQINTHLDNLDLIVIEFPVLADGRVFSFSKLLRRQGYQGEIRAIGNFVTDQMFYMQKVGVDSFELPDDIPTQDIEDTLNRFSVSYQ